MSASYAKHLGITSGPADCPNLLSDHAFTALLVQVLTVHSPFRVENHTSYRLEFSVHLHKAPHMQTAAAGRNVAAITSVPASGPLAAGQFSYLPVPAFW